jgi:anaerobic selenocysteine-containing dehydrogenase
MKDFELKLISELRARRWKRKNAPRSLECIPQETQTESSKLLTVGSFQKETTRAGSSAWYERRIRNAEVVGSNPARSTEPSLPKGASQRKDVPPFVIVFELFISSIASLWARRNGYL